MLGSFSLMMFLLLVVLSTFLTIISSSWFGVWIGLELNLISFVYYASLSSNVNVWGMSKEGVLVYFLIQALGSLLLLFLMMLGFFFEGWVSFMFSKMMGIFMLCCLLLKLGLGPFFVWFPYVMSKLGWLVGLVLITWQKLAPFILCSYFIYNSWIEIIMIMFSSIIGSIGGFNELDLKNLLSYSSVAHGGWMLSLLMHESFIFYFYYFVYFVLVLVIISLVYEVEILSLNEFVFMDSMLIGMWWMLSLMSLGGLPPFLGFFMKWAGVMKIIDLSVMLTLVLVFMALISLFYYLRVIYSLMMISVWVMNYEGFNLKFLSLIFLSFSIGALFVFPFISQFV